jgi:hypothetical protein
LLFPALPLSAGVYFWTDEKGVRHYSNVAPPESERKVERLDEIPPSATKSQEPDSTVGTEPQAPAASEESAPVNEPAPESPQPVNGSAEEGRRESASAPPATPSRVPTEQNEIVRSEKEIVRGLQRQLEQNASRRDEIIKKERGRLESALEQLQKTPLSEFGSQKNKQRALGYYKYRLEALLDAPDSYFQYGDSDIE